MPVYLFTFHAYGTWMPDKPKGYVQRGKGILPADPTMANSYKDRQRQEATTFNRSTQQTLINIVREACYHQSLRLHAITTDASHVHILISWPAGKPVVRIRQNLKQSLTRRLNEQIRKTQWFSRGGSQKRVKDRKHFDHLMKTYLPNHRGLGWYESV